MTSMQVDDAAVEPQAARYSNFPCLAAQLAFLTSYEHQIFVVKGPNRPKDDKSTKQV